ncbi:MAG: EAL domain-containing protein [Gammaproteobacteria bacterium]|nr:EAL domain-containing protein [Gammaproteobacteria bacterium]
MSKGTEQQAAAKKQASDKEQFAKMMGTAIDAVLLVDSKFNLLSQVNIDLLQPADLDITLVPDAAFREFLLSLEEDGEKELKQRARKTRLTGEPERLSVTCEQGEITQCFEVFIQPLAAEDMPGTECVLHMRRTEVTDTPVKQPEHKGESNAELMYDMIKISSDAIIVFDGKQKIKLVNPAYQLLVSKSREELRSANDIHFFDAEEQSINNQIWQSLFYEGHWSGEVYTLEKAESKRPFWLTVDSLNHGDDTATHYLFSLRDISELKDTQAALEHNAAHDQLTGLPNRGFFLTHLEKAAERAKRQETEGALLFIDLDNFKLINDIQGHMVGDVVLLMVATRLKKIFRNGELISRIGGDEFTLIAEDVQSQSNAALIAQRILQELSEPFQIEGAEVEVQCSIGICLFPHADATTSQLIKQADTAMYAAKAGGKNNFQLFDSALTKETTRQFAIEKHLRKAIKNQELLLNYQPQYDMKTGNVIGAEVLLRWHSKELGFVSPAVFIPIAESIGLIDDLGYWVLDTVCKQIAIWRKFSSAPCLMSVNASRLQLAKPDFVKRVVDCLAKHKISGGQLEIEVTENAFTSSEKNMIRNLEALRKLGCKIAIDDFGTGYSSLSNLQTLPLDRLKIDRSFVEKIEYDQNAVTIAAAVISLGKSLGLEIIAEGVETKEQGKQLMKMGCLQAQGYYYGKPIEASEFTSQYLKNKRSIF